MRRSLISSTVRRRQGSATAEVLLEYAAEFIRKHRDNAPWAASVRFVDSREDSLTLAAALEKTLTNFLTQLYILLEENTIVVVASDRGMHYGNFFATEAFYA